MAALAQGRGWRYALQGGFDTGDGEAKLDLRRHGLQAAFWLEPPYESDDMSEMGIYTHVLSEQVRIMLSEQVRISEIGGEPVPLERVPARLFSEVMRDVDLLVSVTTIGNDPTWADRGDQGYGNYWHGYAFGELSEQGEVRRELLERLLPKLAIRDVAEIEGRHLRVRGHLRTYRIHLGSSNIMMEPNDEYLCIVAGRGTAESRVYLPFEGDHMLALILSKALMLARDDPIDDPTIMSQIRRGAP
jgi:hypothetical protein